jgi:D-alanyl-D-alanine carboxypeptidase (penicillin-binding protein 5/6)
MNWKHLKKALLLLCAAILTLYFSTGSADAAATLSPSSLYARYAALIDADSGRVLFEKDGYTQVPNASTTKILTCLVALELGQPDDIIDVSAYAASMPDVQLNITKGDQYRLLDLLHSLMLSSHNDSAVAIAEGIALKYLAPKDIPLYGTGEIQSNSTEASKALVALFMDYVNDRARTIGCSDTYFITPNGLDAEDDTGFHGTSAVDLALIMAECIKNEDFLEITQARQYTFSNVGKTRQHTVTNANAFLSMMDGIISGKTGFTNNAGYCYVCAYKDDGRTFVSVVLACGWPYNKTYKWTDSRKILEYAKASFTKRQVFTSIPHLKSIPVANGLEGETGLYVPGEITTLLSDTDVVNVTFDIPKALTAPILADTQVGSANVYINDMLFATLPIYTSQAVEEWTIQYCLETTLRLFINFDFTIASAATDIL